MNGLYCSMSGLHSDESHSDGVISSHMGIGTSEKIGLFVTIARKKKIEACIKLFSSALFVA